MTKNIQLWNPFESLIPTNPFAPIARRNPFGGLFEDFFNGENMKNALTSDFGFKIVDQKDTREYQFALPGIPSDQIDVQVTGNLLSISVDYKGSDFQRVYRSHVTLPSHVDPEKITSEYKDGLLSISVPSTSEPTVKIPVSAGNSGGAQHQINSGVDNAASENEFEKNLSSDAVDDGKQPEDNEGTNDKPKKHHSGFSDLPTTKPSESSGSVSTGGNNETDTGYKI